MSIIALEQSIAAPADTVFRSVTEIERFPEIQPDVVSVEFVGEKRGGIGTRFIETRRHGNKEMKTDLEITAASDDPTESAAGKLALYDAGFGEDPGSTWDELFPI